MISVCMATYNGEKYIAQQLESILSQIPLDSEVIVSDDGSKDETLSIVKAFNDSRIKVIPGPRQGVVKNFENALMQAKGDIVFLSDQDDIWMPDKVQNVIEVFDNRDISCVLHDAVVTDADGKVIMPSFFEWRGIRHGLINNILKNSYTGCCMAFRRSLIDKSMPFPDNIEMHDWWIGLNAEKNNQSFFLEKQLIQYRRHGNNTNSLDGYSLGRKIKNRLVFIKAII